MLYIRFVQMQHCCRVAQEKEFPMITQPIQAIQKLSSEAAGGNADIEYGFINVDRQRLEREARFARAVFMIDAVLWVGRLVKRAVAAVKADFKLRAAEAQLHRMTDRELADLGLNRADIPFAVRELRGPEGVMPQVDAFTGYATPANQNMRRAA
jgi:uncharacterized protein YjiS (DUF1127 family)